MQKSVGNLAVVIALMFTIVFTVFGIRADASGEAVRFGSESYVWDVGEVSQIGVYASADTNINEIEMYLKYDSEMMEYQSGGELVESGVIKIAKQTINASEYKEMISFVPLIAGDSKISITQANIFTNTDDGATVDDIETIVNTPIPEGCALEGIRLNEIDIPGFEALLTSYNIEVDGSVTDAEIELLPDGIEAEISDTGLLVGTNIITIITRNASGQRARYQLTINRPESIEEINTEVIPELQPEPTVITSGNLSASSRNQIILTAVICMLVIFLISLIIIKIKMVLKNKKKEKHLEELYKRRIKSNRQRSQVLPNRSRDSVLEDDTKKGDLIEISVRRVSMEFTRETDEATSLKEMFIRTVKGQRTHKKFIALKNISFDIRKGEVVGIIGTNGAGKSTILKIISGALTPTKGSVHVDRKKIQLLTLGTGFDVELTGKENVYLNGAIIGYTKEYIDEKYDEIVKFAELEGFMEEKVRNYSSGMVSRLGFAIATVRDTPEILILDEVLSVGDMFFRKKSEARIKEMIHGGSTVLIVSHSASVIEKNCTKAIWLEKGRMKAIGNAHKVCQAYAQYKK